MFWPFPRQTIAHAENNIFLRNWASHPSSFGLNMIRILTRAPETGWIHNAAIKFKKHGQKDQLPCALARWISGIVALPAQKHSDSLQIELVIVWAPWSEAPSYRKKVIQCEADRIKILIYVRWVPDVPCVCTIWFVLMWKWSNHRSEYSNDL